MKKDLEISEGLVLKMLRQKENLTQDELAEKMQITQNYISLLETGRKPLSKKLITKMEKIFNISKDDIQKLANNLKDNKLLDVINIVINTGDKIEEAINIAQNIQDMQKQSQKQKEEDEFKEKIQKDIEDIKNGMLTLTACLTECMKSKNVKKNCILRNLINA